MFSTNMSLNSLAHGKPVPQETLPHGNSPPSPTPHTTTIMKRSCRRLSSDAMSLWDSPTPRTLTHVRGRSSAVACHVGLAVFSSRLQLRRRALYQYNAYLLDENDLILPFYFGKDTFNSQEVPLCINPPLAGGGGG